MTERGKMKKANTRALISFADNAARGRGKGAKVSCHGSAKAFLRCDMKEVIQFAGFLFISMR